MKMQRTLMLAALLMTGATHVHSQAQSGSTQPQLVTVNKKVIVESVTKVDVGTYTPSLPVQAVSREQARYNTPENTAIAMLSAMAAGDYDWWLSIWSEEARAMMTKRYQEAGRKPADIVAPWKGILTTRPAVLVGKADYGRQRTSYALVRYRTNSANELTLHDSKTGKVTPLGIRHFESTMSFRFNNGRWEAVQELAADPVFHGSGMLWDESKTEIRITRPAE